ncbi:MAG: SsrA-binding protein [Pirellulaceae bacterium]|nr:MAG: SsrA-binding protein [Pirellulaceae bacterium]
MSKKGKKKGSTKVGNGPQKPTSGRRSVVENRKVRHHYEILDRIECGMILRGSEVKSLRTGKCQLDEAYGRIKEDKLWLVGCDIPEYPQASVWNHEPKRPRQLLVHRRELTRFLGKAKEKGLTLIPLRIYFNERGIAKCELALCRGLKVYDKREKMRKADARREIERVMKRSYR